MNYIQLKNSDIKDIRNKILEEQNHCCAICKQKITTETGISLDHQHKLSSEDIGKDGGGLVRGVLCRRCNVLEGKIWNNSRRYLGSINLEERIKWLYSLIEYYEKENYNYIHPSEKPKTKKLSKRNYNKCKKMAEKDESYNRKFPDYPKSGKPTKPLISLFERYNIPLY